HQQLVDFVAVDVHHFKLVAAVQHKVGALGDFAQHKHHKTGDGFVVFRLWEMVDFKGAHDIGQRCGAINQPGILVTGDNLFFFIEHQLAHHNAHHIFQGNNADDQGVFIHYHGKVRTGGFKVLQHFV